jgi:hypothetical protein
MHPMFTKLPPELQLLLACCRTALPQSPLSSQQADAELQALVAQVDVDWQEFQRLVEQHGVQPLVYQSSRQALRGWIPADVGQTLSRSYAEGVQRAFHYTAEAVHLSKLFAQHQLTMVPLKGLVLSQRIFGNVGMRHSEDLDIWIDPNQFQQVEQILERAGYKRSYPAFQLSPKQQQVFLEIAHHCHYEHPERQVWIELHWRPYAEDLLPATYSAEMLRRTQPVHVGGHSFNCLADGDLLLYLCLHVAKHQWSRLKWLCDIAALLSTDLAIDWATWQQEIIALGMAHLVAQSLLLAQAFFAAPLPTQLNLLFQKIKSTDQVVADYALFLTTYDDKYMIGGELNLFKFKRAVSSLTLHQDFIRRCAEFRRLWLVVDDWQVVRLPDSLFGLYYVLRPFLWLWRYHV